MKPRGDHIGRMDTQSRFPVLDVWVTVRSLPNLVLALKPAMTTGGGARVVVSLRAWSSERSLSRLRMILPLALLGKGRQQQDGVGRQESQELVPLRNFADTRSLTRITDSWSKRRQ